MKEIGQNKELQNHGPTESKGEDRKNRRGMNNGWRDTIEKNRK